MWIAFPAVSRCRCFLYLEQQKSLHQHRVADTAHPILASTMQKDAIDIENSLSPLAGMAGSGKTTLIQRINAHLHTNKSPVYIINLDPAVTHVPYGSNIDIRDTVNYKNVMQEYNLGPNGGILTACNLFATRFDQVRRPPVLMHWQPLCVHSVVQLAMLMKFS